VNAVDQLARNESVQSWDELRAANDDPQSNNFNDGDLIPGIDTVDRGAAGRCAL
jgi:hypothetical protein